MYTRSFHIPVTGVKTLGLHQAFILSMFIYKKTWLGAEDADWFEFTYKEQSLLSGIQESTLRKYRDQLIKKGLIDKTVSNTLPRKTLYAINDIQLHEYGF